MEAEMTTPQRKAATAGGAAAAIAAAALIATPLIERWEGTKTEPYRDMVGVWTVCTGETRVEMRRYTPAECRDMLGSAIRSDYGLGVLRAVPALEKRPRQLAASISLSYNIGVAAFARSTVARRFNAGDWRGGCDAFLMWRFAGGREVRGLLNRRRDERALCLSGL
jgi:lysozyme